MNVPKLRFKEFADEWQEYVLQNESDVRDGTHDSPKYIDNGYPLITSKNLSDMGTLDFSNVRYLKKEDFDKINERSKVNIGDILFGMIGTIGKPVRVKRDDFAIKNVALIKEKGLIKNDYLIHYLHTPIINKQFTNNQDGGTQKFISLEKIRKMKINIPSREEQKKLILFFNLLDKKIQLQTKKIEALKLFKKGLISKLLNEYDYKIMKIKDVLKFEQPTKYIVNSDDYINDSKAIPVLTANKAFILGYCNENNFYDKGDSIIFDDFTMDMKYTNFNYKVKSSAIKILTAKGNNDLRFLYELLLSLNLKSEEHKRHYISIVQELDVKIPSVEVQKSISSKLELVDNKILFEEKFLNNLTKLKKGFMQSMFV